MPVEEVNLKLAQLVEHQRLLNYAAAKGWIRVANKRSSSNVLQRPTHEERFDQLIVPIDHSFDDYGERIVDVVRRLADFEQRSVTQVLNDLLVASSDVLRFRLDDRTTADGTVGFDEGLELLRGAQKSIRSAACSVVEPQRFHSRLSRAESDLLVRTSRLGQTERGSFVALVILPLNAVPDDVSQPHQMRMYEDDIDTPFVRKTSSHLMRAVNQIVIALSNDRAEDLVQPVDGIQISANLCDALIEMQPPGADARLEITASWAPSFAAEGIPAKVNIPKQMFPGIEECANRLRPTVAPQRDRFIATVAALMGRLNDENKMAGDVTLQFQYDDELLRARATLDAHDYQIACDAHKKHFHISVAGVLVRRGRMHLIEQPQGFRPLLNG